MSKPGIIEILPDTVRYITKDGPLNIPALPDLLAACKALINSHGMHGPCEENSCQDCTTAYRKGKAAIAAATAP